MVARFVTLIPTTIGARPVGDRPCRHGRMVRFSTGDVGAAVEAGGDVDTLLLDKTAPSPSATAGDGCFAGPRRKRAGACGCGAACITSTMNAEGSSIVGAGEGKIRHRKPRHGGLPPP